MSNRKSQNSILVLATLGVYLGLVLVGATPTVLAQAAMTRQFNVKDEIEVKDDLDKKPDKNDPSLEGIQTYLRTLDSYLADVRATDGRLGSVYGQNPEFVLSTPCHAVGNANRPFGSIGTGVITLPILLDPQYRDQNWEWHFNCKPLQSSDVEKLIYTQVEVSGTEKGVFTYQVSIKLPTSFESNGLFQNLERAFRLIKAEDLSNRRQVLFENTKVVDSEDKVTIITRLPRAGLDALLAKDAK